ncbi:helix-turn-helix domain-containing protein [Photobacterium phosphoreum]|uniref:helix-turn-helix domain-containing protein n=1 Tax=Photobacterium phosphoreum TaxID=659 RepID=UPI0024B77579|nr:helix-turn-helix domain-containing protein [Photobacterium phosphoreum]
MKISRINQQKLDLLIQHDTTCDRRIRDRIKAVIHANNNWSPEEMADALFIHETTVRQYIKNHL